MKKLIMMMACCTILTACDLWKDNDPTIFEGKVVFEGDAPDMGNVELVIGAEIKSWTPGGVFDEIQRIRPESDGSFLVEIPNKKEIKHYYIYLEIYVGSNPIPVKHYGYLELDCSPYDCGELKPGKAYRDLVIRVPGD